MCLHSLLLVAFVIRSDYSRAVPQGFQGALLHTSAVLLLKISEINNPGREVGEKLITVKG